MSANRLTARSRYGRRTWTLRETTDRVLRRARPPRGRPPGQPWTGREVRALDGVDLQPRGQAAERAGELDGVGDPEGVRRGARSAGRQRRRGARRSGGPCPGGAPERGGVDDDDVLGAGPQVEQPRRVVGARRRRSAAATAGPAPSSPRQALPTPITPRSISSLQEVRRARDAGVVAAHGLLAAVLQLVVGEREVALDEAAQALLDAGLVLRGRRDDPRVEDRALGVDRVAVPEQPARRLGPAVAGRRARRDVDRRRVRRLVGGDQPQRLVDARRGSRRRARRCCGTGCGRPARGRRRRRPRAPRAESRSRLSA